MTSQRGWQQTAQLNHNKTKVLWCSLAACCQCQILTVPVQVGSTSVQPVSTVRNLGVYLDACISMCAHVTAVFRACFAILCQIRSMRHCLPCAALVTLIRVLILSKIDYCNLVLVGVPQLLLWHANLPVSQWKCLSEMIQQMPVVAVGTACVHWQHNTVRWQIRKNTHLWSI